MEIKNSEQVRKKIEEEYDKNCFKIDDLNKKIKIMNANDFEVRAAFVFVFFILLWGASIFVMPTIIQSGILPFYLVQPLCIGFFPVVISIFVEKTITQKSKCREKLKEFSKSKTQKEKIEELTRYEIEKECLRNLNKVLKKEYDDLLDDENRVNTLLERYNITEKNVMNKLPEEIIATIQSLNDILKEKQREMDIATTRWVLKEKFWKVRDKWNCFFDMLMFSMIGGIVCMALYDMPIVYMNHFFDIQLQPNFMQAVSPLFIGGVASFGYYCKRKKEHTSIFRNMNKELGDDALSEVRDYEEDKQFDKNLENIIKDICIVQLHLENELQKLRNILSNSKSDIDDFQKELENEGFTCDKKIMLDENNRNDIKDTSIEGPKLVKIKK